MKIKGFLSAPAIITLVIVAGLALYFVNCYNTLVRQNQVTDAAWAQVQNQYQRRMDLIPNLVNTVKGEANFEKSTLTDVINARAQATSIQLTPELINNPAQFKQFQQAQSELGSTLSRLMVSIERYPELKSNQQFAQLMDEISGTENRIAVARRDFNSVVMNYDMNILSFPQNLVANMVGLKAKAYFQADQDAAKAPTVNFQ